MKKLITICAVVALMFALSTTTKAETWNVPDEFLTIQEAIDSEEVVDGDTIIVGPGGNHYGAEVTKAVEIKGKGGAVINSGPMRGARMTGFLFLGGDGNGVTISHLSFETVLLPIYSVDTSDVTVDHCTFTSPMQAISNWNGSGWNISHNVVNGLVTDNGGGIGIFVGTWGIEGIADDNLVAHNKITGQVVVPQDEIDKYNQPGASPGYAVPGICLYSDGRRDPAGPMSGNRILKNKVSLSSNNPSHHPAVGIELTDYALIDDPSSDPDLTDNKVGFNDVRGVSGENSVPISLNPAEVAIYNDISRNLGDDADNRGHGLRPKVFFK